MKSSPTVDKEKVMKRWRVLSRYYKWISSRLDTAREHGSYEKLVKIKKRFYSVSKELCDLDLEIVSWKKC